MKKHEKTKNTAYLRGFAVMFSFLILFAGCTSSDNPFSSESTESSISIDDLNINVKYAESYDQTSITFSRRWPSSISRSLAKTVDEGGEIMTDFEQVSKLIAFDEEGYLYTSTNYIEGDSQMNMPESIYEEVRRLKPAEDINKDPIVRIEFSNGHLRHYGRSGELLSEHSFNPEDFRLEEEALDALAIYNENSDSEDHNVSNSINYLNSLGLQYDIIGDFYADVEQPISNQDNSGVTKYKYRLDLRTGEKLEEVAYNLQNKPIHYRISSFVNVDGQHMLQRELFYEYGNLNNNWEIVGRKVTTRTNHKIILQ